MKCYDCCRRYGDEHGFPDLVIPREDWAKISPTGDDGGLLCPCCICRRLHEAGIRTRGEFRSGPLVVFSDGPVTRADAPEIERLRAEIEALKHDLSRYMGIANEHANEVERLREALTDIAVYGCGMLNQPIARNGPEEVWLRKRIAAYERRARAALGERP